MRYTEISIRSFEAARCYKALVIHPFPGLVVKIQWSSRYVTALLWYKECPMVAFRCTASCATLCGFMNHYYFALARFFLHNGELIQNQIKEYRKILDDDSVFDIKL